MELSLIGFISGSSHWYSIWRPTPLASGNFLFMKDSPKTCFLLWNVNKIGFFLTILVLKTSLDKFIFVRIYARADCYLEKKYWLLPNNLCFEDEFWMSSFRQWRQMLTVTLKKCVDLQKEIYKFLSIRRLLRVSLSNYL